MGSTHHWMTGHAFCLLKAAAAFHWPTRVDCNLEPHLPAQLAKCPLQHSHAECSDCCHEGISGDKTNGSKPHSTTRYMVVFLWVETGIRIVIYGMIWWSVLQHYRRHIMLGTPTLERISEHVHYTVFLFTDYCTLSFVFSFRNGRITVRAASTYQGWLMKWIPLNRAGKQSWRPSIISFRTRGLRLEDCLNENSLQSTTTTKPFNWLRGFSISLSIVSNKAR